MKTLTITLKLLLITVFFISCNSQNIKNEFTHPLPATADTNIVLPPSWAFGMLYGAYTNQDQSIELINQIIEHDYPIDAFWIDSWIWDWRNKGFGPDKYIDFIADTLSYSNMQEMWGFMEEKGIKSGMWVWDCILQTGNEEVYEEFKSRGFFKREYIRKDTWHNGGKTTIKGDNSQTVNGTWCGDIDFENPEAVSYFRKKMKHFFDKGIDFIKLDKTDAIPVCKAVFEMTQDFGKETNGRGFILSHSNGVEREEYKKYPAKWTDDTRSDWSVTNPQRKFSSWLPKVAFKENLEMYTDISKHHHKTPFLSNDMGGFAVSKDKYIDEELYIRWLEFATFVPLTTVFSQPENQTGNIAFKVSDRADKIFKDYAHLKMELFPYIYTYAHKSRLEGKNTIRVSKDILYQYLFGEELLVAPVYEQGAEERKIFLPQNSSWINYWTGEVFKGNQIIKVYSPLDQIPLFVKQGAIIPKRKYASSIAAGNNDLLELHAYLGSNGNFTLIEDDETSNDYLKGVYAKTIIKLESKKDKCILVIEPILGYYENMDEFRQWEIVFFSQKNIEKIFLNENQTDFNHKENKYSIEIFRSKKSVRNKISIHFTKN